MLSFFDFIFYKTYKFYFNWGDDLPGVYALSVITLFQSLNITTIIFFYLNFLETKLYNYSKLILFISFLSLFLLNYLRIYKAVGLKILISKYDEIAHSKKKALSRQMILYMIVSLIALFISILY